LHGKLQPHVTHHRGNQSSLLQRFSFHHVPGNQPHDLIAINFITVLVGKANEVFRRLLKRGVIVRPVGGAYQLPEHLRVTIGTAAENERFLAALAASLKE